MRRDFGLAVCAATGRLFQQPFRGDMAVITGMLERVYGILAGENRRGPPMLATPTGHFATSLTTTGGSAWTV